MRILLVILIAVSGWAGIRQFQMTQRADLERAATEAVVNADVVVYVTSWCDVCAAAREHLDVRGIDYVARDIEASPEAYDAYRARGGTGAVPMIVIGDETLMGFNPETVDARLLAMSN